MQMAHGSESCLPAGGLQVESDIAPSRSAIRTQLHAAAAAQLEINHHQPFTTHTVHSLSIVHSLPTVHLLPTVHCPFTTHCLSLPLSAYPFIHQRNSATSGSHTHSSSFRHHVSIFLITGSTASHAGHPAHLSHRVTAIAPDTTVASAGTAQAQISCCTLKEDLGSA